MKYKLLEDVKICWATYNAWTIEDEETRLKEYWLNVNILKDWFSECGVYEDLRNQLAWDFSKQYDDEEELYTIKETIREFLGVTREEIDKLSYSKYTVEKEIMFFEWPLWRERVCFVKDVDKLFKDRNLLIN